MLPDSKRPDRQCGARYEKDPRCQEQGGDPATASHLCGFGDKRMQIACDESCSIECPLGESPQEFPRMHWQRAVISRKLRDCVEERLQARDGIHCERRGFIGRLAGQGFVE